MNLHFSAADSAFREEVRHFLEAELPQDIRHKVSHGLILDSQDYLRWQRLLHARGWGGPAWPVEHGGCGWNAVQQYIFEEEAGNQNQGMFNPVTSMFSVWERAFRDVTSLTNKNLATANKAAENGAYTAANSLSETADMVDAEVHDYEHAERKHSGASKKK